MSQKQAGGIFASSFIAGLLLAAAIVSPRAWEPVPGPYFGLDEPAAPDSAAMEAAHAELSARKQTQWVGQPKHPAIHAVATPVANQIATPVQNQVAATAPASTPDEGLDRVTVDAVPQPAAVPLVQAPVVASEPRQAAAGIAGSGPQPEPAIAATHKTPPAAAERLALATTSGPAATAAMAVATPPVAAAPTKPAVAAPVDPPVPTAAPAAVTPAAATLRVAAAPQPTPQPTPQPVSQPVSQPDAPGAPGPEAAATAAPTESLKGMAQRVRPAQPGENRAPSAATAAATAADPSAPPSRPPTAAVVADPQPRQSWSEAFAQAPPIGPLRTEPLPAERATGRGTTAEPAVAAEQKSATDWAPSGPLGAAPLPGEPWNDPDGVNWSDALGTIPTFEPDRRKSLLGERRHDARAAEPRSSGHGPGGRILERLRGTDRRLAQVPEPQPVPPPETVFPDIGVWPRPARLEQQLDQLASLSAAASSAAPVTAWTSRARDALTGVQDTRGPRDPAADSSLIVLGEAVLAGMSQADVTSDASLATLTRRTALAAARRVAVWRSAAALFGALDRDPRELSVNDAGAAIAKQAAGRTVVEIARLLDAIERFESSPSAAQASAVTSALGTIASFYPTAARGMLKAVEDHYLAPNVRIAVHQEFLERMLPGATVDTSRFQDVVLGREVRGTRTVERTTVLRLVPDEDEISFHLEVHGDIASRAITDAGPVSVTARSTSEFTVHKPIKISSQGLLFGQAKGFASNRSHVDNIQTSFDSVPVMGSLVRNMARNQQADAMPEANREVIDKIVSRACREVDTQAEPQFAQMADRVRARVWLPLERLGLEPTAVAMQTTPTLATMRLRLAADSQLAAHTPRPRASADAMLSLQVHESSANNALARLAIAGRRLTLEELIGAVCTQLGIETRIPDELPPDVTVAFAQEQPLRVECRDGLVHVYVDLDAIESGRRDWYDISTHVAYKPVCAGQQVFLEREGPIQLRGKGQEGRMELALRTVFGKIFPKERRIALLPESVAANPRLADMQASQAITSDGWLAVAFEQRPEPPTVTTAPGKPAPNRQGDTRRKALFR